LLKILLRRLDQCRNRFGMTIALMENPAARAAGFFVVTARSATAKPRHKSMAAHRPKSVASSE
jgi:hypothetical protein